MKITIEPTKDLGYSTVSVIVHKDDLTISEFWEDLILPALLAHGFQEKTINEFFELD